MKKYHSSSPPHIQAICVALKKQYGCHTALLYGSRAIGNATKLSDYDVIGIRKSGPKLRIAKKVNNAYWDLFIYSEKEVHQFGDHHRCWDHAVVLFEKNFFGKKLMNKLKVWLKKSRKPIPLNEVKALKVWSKKQLRRCSMLDIHGLYRRAELQMVAVEHYFLIRRKNFLGPKGSFQWLEENDPKTLRLFLKMFNNPTNLQKLKALVNRVYLQK